MSIKVTIKETVHIAARPEDVWDLTQDYSRRAEWDDLVLGAEVLQEEPIRLVRVHGKDGLSFTAKYTLFRRLQMTSLAMIDVESSWASGGGGSWLYEAHDGGTLWTQTNTLSIKNLFLYRLLRPLFERQLHSGTQRAMHKAKQLLETQPR